TQLNTLSLHDALPICVQSVVGGGSPYLVSQLTGSYTSVPQFLDTQHQVRTVADAEAYLDRLAAFAAVLDVETERTRADYAKGARSEEHTSELQSRENL